MPFRKLLGLFSLPKPALPTRGEPLCASPNLPTISSLDDSNDNRSPPTDWAVDALVAACAALNQNNPAVALSTIREALWSRTGVDL